LRTLLGCLFLMVAPVAAAQTETPATTEAPAAATTRSGPLNTVTVNVLGSAFGAYSVEYERVLSPSLSFFVEPTFFSIRPAEGFNLGVNGPGVVTGVHYFLFGQAPSGLFLSPELYLTYIDSLGDAAGPRFGLGAGAVVGWTFLFFDFLDLSLGLGAAANLLGYQTTGHPGFGVAPLIRANLGVAF